MSTEEAKRILSAHRLDDQSVVVRQAVQRAQDDPRMAAWLIDQRTLDEALRRGITEQPVPASLRELILDRARVPAHAARMRLSPVWGLAAMLVLTSMLVVVVIGRPSASLDEFRLAMAREVWPDGGEHVDFTSSNLAVIQVWLKAKGASSIDSLPAAVSDCRIRGARIVEFSGRQVPILCLLENGKHLHLCVVPNEALAQSLDPAMPQFEKLDGWRTVAWSHRNHTYLLHGINHLSFIRKSRKGGQWVFAGSADG